MSDNELDNLFKEAAGEFKAPKDPSAWEGMAKRLDQAGVGTAGFWNWKTISTMGVVGITGIASILYFAKTDVKPADAIVVATETTTQNQKETNEVKPAGASAIELNKKSNPGEPTQKPSSDLAVNENKEAESGVANVNTRENKVAKSNEAKGLEKSQPTEKAAKSNSIQNNKSANALESRPESKDNSSEFNKVTEPNRLAPQQPSTTDSKKIVSLNVPLKSEPVSAGEEQNTVKQKEEKSVAENTVTLNKQQMPELVKTETSVEKPGVAQVNATQSKNSSDDVLVSFDSTEVVQVKDDLVKSESPDSENKSEDEKAKTKNRGIAIKVAIAPDYSSVESTTPSGLGYGYGLLFEYRFSNHWSVATGGIWEKKIYSAKEVEYNGHKANSVDGDCRMWDIPVNVYYSFAPARRLSFYAGLGFSSYLMSKENYVLHYDGSYGTYDRKLEVKGKNNEWFKMLNASVGMQMRLNNVLSLQLEPTLKAPLAGVGEGEVSLVSLGAFFNIRFDIPITKK